MLGGREFRTHTRADDYSSFAGHSADMADLGAPSGRSDDLRAPGRWRSLKHATEDNWESSNARRFPAENHTTDGIVHRRCDHWNANDVRTD